VSEQFVARYEHIEQLYYSHEYAGAASEAHTLLRDLLLAIYLKARDGDAAKRHRAKLTRLELQLLKHRGLDKTDLPTLTKLCEASNAFNLARRNSPLLPILRTRNLRAVAALCADSIRASPRAHEDTLKRNVHDLFVFLTHLLTFMGWDPRKPKLVVSGHDLPTRRAAKTFDVDLDTGIMTNPSDQSRNVSFKAITFGLMLGNICTDLLSRLPLPNDTGSEKGLRSDQPHVIGTALLKAGEDAGRRFGTALAGQLPQEMPLLEKIALWCDFDTSVGWGRFESALTMIDEHHVVGKIVLHNNFLVADKGPLDFNLCELMTGYISGVLSAMLGVVIQVRHDKHGGDCAQTQPGKDTCDFGITVTKPTHSSAQ
jgi:predicted hydrocarbon binding protein